MDVFPWKCPACGHATTITSPNFALKTTDVWCESTQVGKALKMHSLLIECPNQECRSQSFKVTVWHGKVTTDAKYTRFVKVDDSSSEDQWVPFHFCQPHRSHCHPMFPLPRVVITTRRT